MTARYKLTLRTPDSTINATGMLQSPEQWAVVNAALNGKLVDDHKLLKAAPALRDALANMIESYQYEASAENPALLQAKAALALLD